MPSSENSQNNLVLNDYLKDLRPYLFAFTYRICANASDAEDIAQNILLKAYLDLCESGRETTDDRLWAYAMAYQELKSQISQKKTWSLQEDQLISPFMTPSSFWFSVREEQQNNSNCMDQKESFHIGFLTQLQKISFEQRFAYCGVHVLGFGLEDLAKITSKSVTDLASLLRDSEAFMKKYYFSRDSKKILWRGEEPSDPDPFVKTLNTQDKEKFKTVVDPDFRCLMLPAPILNQNVFFDEFLPRLPRCQMLDFEINGQQVLAFQDGKEVQALAIMLHSSTGVSTLLGYDIDGLDPQIRTRTLFCLASESSIH